MIRAIIIDDEPSNQETLYNYLKLYCTEVNVIDSAKSVKSGISIIRKLDPHIIFLDIKLEDGSGFDILKQFSNRHFEVIFTTAYEEYAINAIKENACDYIVKPFSVNELEEAVEKAKNNLLKKRQFSIIDEYQYKNSRLKLPTREGTELIYISKIVWCHADGSYTRLGIFEKEPVFISKNLKYFDDNLPHQDFIRVHKSYLINIRYVKSYKNKPKGMSITMFDSKVVLVSQNYKKIFLNRMNNLNRL